MSLTTPIPEDVKIDSRVEHPEDLKPGRGDNHGHVDGNALLINRDGEVRKIPVPSSDPNDPLNFRKWEKYGLVFCCCWFSTLGLSIASGLGAIINEFFQMYGLQGYSIVLLITVPTLCIGLGKFPLTETHGQAGINQGACLCGSLGNYIILRLPLAYGRRPVFLGFMVILLIATVAAALQNSYNGHLASRRAWPLVPQSLCFHSCSLN